MTPAELTRVRRDLFRKARELGAIREEAEDLAQEAIACFLRWRDGGEGSQLSHAITHARGSLYGWTGTGKAARVRTRPAAPEIYAEDLPPEEWSTLLLTRSVNPEPRMIAEIDFAQSVQRAEPGALSLYMDAEFSPAPLAEVARRYGISLRTLERRLALFRQYLENAMNS